MFPRLWRRHDHRPVHTAAQTDPAPPEVAVAISRAAGGGWDDLEHLVEVLAALDATGAPEPARAALGLLARAPRTVARLDEHVREDPWSSPHRSPVRENLAARLDRPSPGAVAVALAGAHGNGRIRERAVRAMLAAPVPEMAPFLVLRTGDWVGQVRDPARAGLATLLADDPAAYLPAVLPTALLVGARSRGGFAVTQVLAALLAAPAPVRRALGGSGPAEQRRLVFTTGLAHGWLHRDDLVEAAESDADVLIRVRAAEAACRDAVWTGRIATLRRLAGSRRPPVRAIALTGLLRLGHLADVSARLDDPANLVRAIAREAARRDGTDATAHYRRVVAGDAPTPGAVAGFTETAPSSDAALLHPLVTHPTAAIRAAAVRGLRLLDAVDTHLVVPRLRDPAPAVVREAATALRPLAGALPPALPWDLLADPRVELRRAGYRLLGTRDVHRRLRAGLLLAVDPDPGLARRGRADVVRLARDAVRPTWRHTSPPVLPATAAEADDLHRLARDAAPALGDECVDLLTTWLRDR
ncbi:hypothetical protein ACIBJE_26025 [Micromonospora sp. NPDC050187]|uniref:hypothetical protein n=1 Tax=Micromonospora sp. NPDC050187 TaxID=3364277 RepID=UPI0037A0EEEF